MCPISPGAHYSLWTALLAPVTSCRRGDLISHDALVHFQSKKCPLLLLDQLEFSVSGVTSWGRGLCGTGTWSAGFLTA